jgi:hypothetical protein
MFLSIARQQWQVHGSGVESRDNLNSRAACFSG